MTRFVQFPWGDIVNVDHVAGASVNRDGVGFHVVVAMKTEGLVFVGSVRTDEVVVRAELTMVRNLLLAATSSSDDDPDPPDG